MQDTINWSEENFKSACEKFTHPNSSNRHDTGNNGQSTGSQTTHIYVYNDRGLDFWDYLLLQCCIDSLFGGRGHTTNVANINYSSNESREDKKKESEDSRKLLALGIVVQLCVLLSMLVCVFGIAAAEKRLEKKKK